MTFFVCIYLMNIFNLTNINGKIRYKKSWWGESLMTTIRRIKNEEFNKAMELALDVYMEFEAPVYHNFGFVDTDCEQLKNGIRYTPMMYLLDTKNTENII